MEKKLRYDVDFDGPYSPTWYETTGLAPVRKEVITTPMGKMTVLEIKPPGPGDERGRIRAKLFKPLDG